MSELNEAKGSCLCGAIHFTARKANKGVGACHCGMCRKWGGGALMAVNSGSDVLFKGEENISVYDSSAWAERGFCKQCGSHLFYRLKESRQHIIPVGLFENQESFVFENQVFIDKKPSFYSFSNKTNNMTEAEVFEMYGAS
ncbi:MAG: GFA family protein [Gammaproteobacteria bacterium]|nr:GFA family protein [Gammaproteobacteria bacterium]